jgi:hypothetical protein
MGRMVGVDRRTKDETFNIIDEYILDKFDLELDFLATLFELLTCFVPCTVNEMNSEI